MTMSALEPKQEAFPKADGTSRNGNNMSSASPSTYPNRRRARTREIPAGSPSPPWPTKELSKPDEQGRMPPSLADMPLHRATAALGLTDDHDAQPSPSARHNRSPSAARPKEVQSRGNYLMRSDSSSSQGSNAQGIGRKGVALTSPPNAWQQWNNASTSDQAAFSSTQQSMSQSRSRSGSNGSFAGSEKSPIRPEAQLPASPSSRSLASFRRSMSRRSISSVQNESASPMCVPDPLDPTGQLVPQQYRSDISPDSVASNEKRKLFGRREENTNASGKGMVRKVSSKTFFGINRDRSQDANTSSDTLGSASSSSTARMEMGKKAGESSTKTSFSQWSRRSKKSTPGQRDEQADDGVTSPASVVNQDSEVSTITAEEEFSDLAPRADGNQVSTNPSNGYHDSATNGADLHDRGEGLPKRLSGWLSHILTTSTSSSDDGKGHLSASDSHATVRRKTSALNLYKNDSSDRLSSTSALSPQPGSASSNGSQASTSRARNTGLIATLSSSTKGRADSASSHNGGGARSGLDRALRYFIDSGDQQQSQEEGIWLLGVWHGPTETVQETDTGKQKPVIAVTNPSPQVRDSRSSTLEGDTSSASRLGSDVDQDDVSILTSSRRTRETSPAASASTGGSLGRASKIETVDEDFIVARNPPTPQSAKTTAVFATPIALASNALQSTRLGKVANSSNGTYMASFQADFSSRIWCTYRSQFVPISRDGTISNEAEMAAEEAAAAAAQSPVPAGVVENKQSGGVTVNQFGQVVSSIASSPGTLGTALGMPASLSSTMTSSLSDKMGIPGLWGRATAAAQSYGLAGRAGLTTDAGWGCMLRTGQSVLANALLNVHLGRDWRRDSGRDVIEGTEQKRRKDYAKYIELLSWFMDDPSLACPFGVHRMAREGKRLGKEVGEWFGPSTAAGAIKKLVDDFPEAGLGVSLASDGVIYLDQVRAQAQTQGTGKQQSHPFWTRPVLILIGIRLGLDGVHPMYHDSIKATFSFPHSVGIAGGRPSSSYYFMGYQGNSLFYLDPHHVRSSIPFRHPPLNEKEKTSWWLKAYSDAELSTFHNDRPRRMPMKSLDPSMLLGFLISDESSLQDFVTRVKALPRPIFSVLDSMPKWMMEGEEAALNDEEKALESLSESSLDDGLERDEETSTMAAHDGRGTEEDRMRDVQQGQQLEQSAMSSSTMTPRPESTFEFVDRHPVGLSPRPVPGRARRSYINGSQHDKNDAPSVAGSDAGSAWEEVGVDSLQRGELSSPVDGAFPVTRTTTP